MIQKKHNVTAYILLIYSNIIHKHKDSVVSLSMSSIRKNHLIIVFLAGFLLILLGSFQAAQAQNDGAFRIARLSYRGGDDWYNDPSSLTNLIKFTRKYVPIDINLKYDDISVGSPDLFKYPFAFITGHGYIAMNDAEIENVRKYLENGGFLYIDDDYGFDKYIRPVIKRIFPNDKMIELPFSHPIYHQVFDFPNGVPKIHKHDGLPAQGFGVYHNGRLVIYYTYQTNLADGWADQDIHHDPEAIRIKALKMGVNLLVFALTHDR